MPTSADGNTVCKSFFFFFINQVGREDGSQAPLPNDLH